MAKLSEVVSQRIRIEWPGTHVTRDGRIFEAPEIRPGGATDALIAKICQIIDQEVGDKF